MLLNNRMINLDGMTLFKCLQSETLTVPEFATQTSPVVTGGLAAGTGSTRKPVGGGMLYGVLTDAAGPTSVEFAYPLKPGDVVLLSAAGASGTVKVNGKTVLTIASTAVFGVLGFYG